MLGGRFFWTEDPGLVPFVTELDGRVAVAFPEFVDGRAERRLRLVPDQVSGRGVELAEGASVAKDDPADRCRRLNARGCGPAAPGRAGPL